MSFVFTVQHTNGETEDFNGPVIFRGESFRVGMNGEIPQDGWEKVTAYAPGKGGPQLGKEQHGQRSLVLMAARRPWEGNRQTTDMYFEAEFDDDTELVVQQGPPSWEGDDLDKLRIGDDVYHPGRWTKVTVFSKGWSDRAPEIGAEGT